MIIGCCGYGATGSSVITDLLKEFDDIQVYDSFEFWLTYRVDGLEDLEYHLIKQYAKGTSCDYAIKRFLQRAKCFKTPFINKPCDGKTFFKLSKEFINEITQIEYMGIATADILSDNIIKNIFAFASKKIFMPCIIEKITNKPSYLWPCRKVYYSIEPENFYTAARKYIKNIIKAMGADTSLPVCLDQPFEGNNPLQSFPFFEDPYAILVDRDPRDLYLASKYTKDPNFKFIPRTNVEDFVVYYRNIRKNQVKDKRILRLNFEECVYDYDSTVKKVMNFLNLKKHTRPKTEFNPQNSINNTQLIRLHPEDKADIEYIEKELPEHLFPFHKYSGVEFTGNPFDGAARKAFKQA